MRLTTGPPRWVARLAVLCAALLLCATSAAQPAEPPSTERLEQAKQLFQQGNALRNAGDCEQALVLYARSRELLASISNTLNAAICLDRLGRRDEALEMYELLLTGFRERLTPKDVDSVAPAMARLRRQVGSVDVSANVRATLVIDGRPRGALPRLTPVRVMPGKHRVYVIAEGYRSFEKIVTVRTGRLAVVEARLSPLGKAGKLRVDDSAIAGAEIFIDGARVGKVPWEGSLAPGAHVLVVRKGDRGTAPRRVQVVQGQTTRATGALLAVGPGQRIMVRPTSAELSIDGVPVGAGGWSGRLPLGRHRLEAREAGYRAAAREVTVQANRAPELVVELEIDPDHPRWGASKPGRIWLEALGALALSGDLGSDAEDACETHLCADDGLAMGWMAALRGGYETPIGLSVEALGGYLTLRKQLTRAYSRVLVDNVNGATIRADYRLDDDIRLSGPLVGAGISYRLELSGHVDLRAHFALGALFGRASDSVGGTVTVDGRSADVLVAGSGESVGAPTVWAMPELRLGMRFGGFHSSVGFAAAIFALAGPEYPADLASRQGELRLVDESQCDPTSGAATAVECVGGSDLVAGESAFNAFVLWMPSVTVGYAF